MDTTKNMLPGCRAFVATLKKCMDSKTILEFAKSMIKRERLVHAKDFLTFCISNNDSLATISLEEICQQYATHTGIPLTTEGMNKRFNRASVEFLRILFEHLLTKMVTPTTSISVKFCEEIKRIRLLDATIFQLDESYESVYRGFGGGSSKAGVKIQFEYELLSGTFLNVAIQNAVDNDNVYGQRLIDSIKKGDLCIRDLGYAYIKDFQAMNQKGAFFISRLTSQHSLYEKIDNSYKKVDVKSFCDVLQPGEHKEFSELYMRKGELKVRVIVYRLKEKELENREDQQNGGRKNNGAVKNKKSPTSEINVLITNLDENQVPGGYLYQFYALRWQIELMFKTWKSIFKIHDVKKMKIERFECHLYGQLIKILMCSCVFYKMKVAMYKKERKELSEQKGIRLVKAFWYRICQALFDIGEELSLILEEVFEIFHHYGQKARRQQKIQPFEFLNLTKESSN